MEKFNLIERKDVQKLAQLSGKSEEEIMVLLWQYGKMDIVAVDVLAVFTIAKRFPNTDDIVCIQTNGIVFWKFMAHVCTIPANFMIGNFTYN